MIAHNKPFFDHNDIDAAVKVLKSGMLAQNGEVKDLENRLSKAIGQKYCLAISSGTTALSLALKALDVKQQDEVIIPSYTCSALYYAIKFNHATPIFADIETDTCNLSPDSVKQHLSSNTKAIIFPHMFGQPGYIEAVKAFGVPVIEDIAQAVGAKIKDQPVGCFGDIAITSFYATKMLGAGEGGAILTNNSKVFDSLADIRDYDEKPDLTLRYNAKMTDLTAAIALSQLDKLDFFIKKRSNIANKIINEINHPIEIPSDPLTFMPNFYRLIIAVKNPDAFIAYGSAQGVQFRRPVYKPLHHFHSNKQLPVTNKKWEEQVSIPLYPKLTDSEVKTIISVINNFSAYVK